jgi:hypothetical protein
VSGTDLLSFGAGEGIRNLDPNLEWVTIASLEECAYLIREEEPLPVLPGLFEDVLERLKETAY